MKNLHDKVHFKLHAGALHKALGIPEGQPIPAELMRKKMAEAKRNGDTHMEKMLQFAMNAKKFNH